MYYFHGGGLERTEVGRKGLSDRLEALTIIWGKGANSEKA